MAPASSLTIIQGLMAQEELDGALVGGASLDPKSFAALVNLPSAPARLGIFDFLIEGSMETKTAVKWELRCSSDVELLYLASGSPLGCSRAFSF